MKIAPYSYDYTIITFPKTNNIIYYKQKSKFQNVNRPRHIYPEKASL